jgi:hypothetical protein
MVEENNRTFQKHLLRHSDQTAEIIAVFDRLPQTTWFSLLK